MQNPFGKSKSRIVPHFIYEFKYIYEKYAYFMCLKGYFMDSLNNINFYVNEQVIA